MNRHYALVALWVIFAAAAVGVGFGAAGLAGDPFTGPDTAGQAAAPVIDVSPAPDASPTRDAPTGDDRSGDATGGSSSPSASGGSESGDGAAQVRGVTTRGGYVQARCRAGIVTLSASPSVGWQVDDLEDGRAEGEVKFERSGDGDGRVEVKAQCSAGVPRFSVEIDGDSGSGGDDGGGGDNSGHGGGD